MPTTLFVDLLEEYSAFAHEPSSVDIDIDTFPGGGIRYRLADMIRNVTIACRASIEETLEKAGVNVFLDSDAQAVVEIVRMPHTWGMRFGRCRNGLVFASTGILPSFGSSRSISPYRSHTEYSSTFSGAIRLLRQNVDPALTDLRKWIEHMKSQGHIVRLRRIRGEHPYYRVEMTTKHGRYYRSHGSDPYSALMLFGVYVSDSASAFFMDEDEQ